MTRLPQTDVVERVQIRQRNCNPDQSNHDPDTVAFNDDLFHWYQKFIALRNNYKAIQKGSYEPFLINDSDQVYGFSRKLDGEEVVVLINRSNKEVEITDAKLKKGAYKDAFSKKAVSGVKIKAMDVVVLSNR